MSWLRWLSPLLLAGLVAVPAQASPDAADAAGALGEDRCSPPCGYVIPLMQLNFPDKPQCTQSTGIQTDFSSCPPLPAPGTSLAYEGTVVWWWDASDQLIYPNDPNAPIVIRFEEGRGNPSIVDVRVEPETFTLGTADLFDPTHLRQEGDPAAPRVLFWYERNITVTLTFTGEPTEDDLVRATQRGGFEALLKTKSNASSDFIREGWGYEVFYFSGEDAGLDGSGGGRDSPAPAGALLGLLLVGLAFLARARRQA